MHKDEAHSVAYAADAYDAAIKISLQKFSQCTKAKVVPFVRNRNMAALWGDHVRLQKTRLGLDVISKDLMNFLISHTSRSVQNRCSVAFTSRNDALLICKISSNKKMTKISSLLPINFIASVKL